MAKKEKPAAKDKAGKKDKKGKKGGGDAQGASIVSHPRAKASIRRAKGWAGLAGFVLAAVLSLQASVPLFDVGLRALGAGVVGYMLAWWVGVMLWRQLIVAEHKAAYAALQRRRAEAAEAEAEKPRTPARPAA